MARTLALMVVGLLLCASPQAQETSSPSKGVLLNMTSRDGRAFTAMIMTSGASIESATGDRVSRAFPTGTSLAVMLEAAPNAEVVLQIEVRSDNVARPKSVSASGHHVTGEVLAGEPRVSAFH
jgi:hypothetical protein